MKSPSVPGVIGEPLLAQGVNRHLIAPAPHVIRDESAIGAACVLKGVIRLWNPNCLVGEVPVRNAD